MNWWRRLEKRRPARTDRSPAKSNTGPRSGETVLRHQDVQALKRSPADATLTVPARRAVQAVLERLVADKKRGTLASRLKAGRVVYQSDPAGSGLTERVSPDG